LPFPFGKIPIFSNTSINAATSHMLLMDSSFEGDEVFGVERGSHGGERILYLGVIAKEKAPPSQR